MVVRSRLVDEWPWQECRIPDDGNQTGRKNRWVVVRGVKSRYASTEEAISMQVSTDGGESVASSWQRRYRVVERDTLEDEGWWKLLPAVHEFLVATPILEVCLDWSGSSGYYALDFDGEIEAAQEASRARDRETEDLLDQYVAALLTRETTWQRNAAVNALLTQLLCSFSDHPLRTAFAAMNQESRLKCDSRSTDCARCIRYNLATRLHNQNYWT